MCKKLLVFTAQSAVIFFLFSLLLGGVVLVLSTPVVQVDSATKEVVAVITYDGVVHPPSYLVERGLTKYTLEYVAPGYRPAKFGITERELRDLKE